MSDKAEGWPCPFCKRELRTQNELMDHECTNPPISKGTNTYTEEIEFPEEFTEESLEYDVLVKKNGEWCSTSDFMGWDLNEDFMRRRLALWREKGMEAVLVSRKFVSAVSDYKVVE